MPKRVDAQRGPLNPSSCRGCRDASPGSLVARWVCAVPAAGPTAGFGDGCWRNGRWRNGRCSSGRRPHQCSARRPRRCPAARRGGLHPRRRRVARGRRRHCRPRPQQQRPRPRGRPLARWPPGGLPAGAARSAGRRHGAAAGTALADRSGHGRDAHPARQPGRAQPACLVARRRTAGPGAGRQPAGVDAAAQCRGRRALRRIVAGRSGRHTLGRWPGLQQLRLGARQQRAGGAAGRCGRPPAPGARRRRGSGRPASARRAGDGRSRACGRGAAPSWSNAGPARRARWAVGHSALWRGPRGQHAAGDVRGGAGRLCLGARRAAAGLCRPPRRAVAGPHRRGRPAQRGGCAPGPAQCAGAGAAVARGSALCHADGARRQRQRHL